MLKSDFKPIKFQNLISFVNLADFTHGEFGRGLYFSKFPSKAAQFSAVSSVDSNLMLSFNEPIE